MMMYKELKDVQAEFSYRLDTLEHKMEDLISIVYKLADLVNSLNETVERELDKYHEQLFPRQ